MQSYKKNFSKPNPKEEAFLRVYNANIKEHGASPKILSSMFEIFRKSLRPEEPIEKSMEAYKKLLSKLEKKLEARIQQKN